MCGIAGILDREGPAHGRELELRQMLAMIRHRGPDQFGIYCDEQAGLASARLSIIDLNTGQQPISNEDQSLWIVFNGEIFNYPKLREELEKRGHRFTTQTDTEVVLHLYEERGPECLARLNGQFAIAIWDTKTRTLFLARDRLGVRPLFYTRIGKRMVFASEIKALLAVGVTAEIDQRVLPEVFTYWSPLSPHTVFRNVLELPPGHFLLASEETTKAKVYWEPSFREESPDKVSREGGASLQRHVEELTDLLVDATRIRLRADVAVGAYLSGGLDSSTIASIIRHCTSNRLDTFSIAFDDQNYDESRFQREMARHLGTEHQVLQASHADIGRVFPEVIWHTETPLMRTSPAPMFLLSKLVRDRGYKVVLTGEGADELLGGYDVFKEAKLRRFWARQPASVTRPLLFSRLYRDIPGFGNMNPAFLGAFFKDQLTNTGSPYYSHFIRWRNNLRTCRFFSEEVQHSAPVLTAGFLEQVPIPAGFSRWGSLERAQYLEITIFLSQYLLSSQGDRVAMAHSIEGRYPFLDCRVVDYCAHLPPRLKLRGLTEKYLLKHTARRWLPTAIWQRTKRPYRAPIYRSFFNDHTPDYVLELCSADQVRKVGLFKTQAVDQLLNKVRQGVPVGETDDMALAGIVSTQLLHFLFIENLRRIPPLESQDSLKRCGPMAIPAKPPYDIHQGNDQN